MTFKVKNGIQLNNLTLVDSAGVYHGDVVGNAATATNSAQLAGTTPTAAGLALLDDADATAQRATLGLVIGTNVQAYNVDIPTVAASQAEMEAGTSTSLRSMTPARVAQAIAALTPQTGFTLGTAVTPTGVASVTFTGIPSTAKCVIITYTGISTTSASQGTLKLQIGPVGGVETTGYTSYDATSTHFNVNGYPSSGSAGLLYGQIIMTLIDASTDTWIMTAQAITIVPAPIDMAQQFVSKKAITGNLERLTFALSVGNFDAGTVNIMYN